MNNPFLRQLHPAIQLLFLVILFFVLSAMGGLVALKVGAHVLGGSMENINEVLSEPKPEHASALRWMATISQLSSFLLPSLIFLLLFGRKNVHGFMLGNPGLMLLAGPLYIFASNGWVSMADKLNQSLIPVGSWLESVVKPMEEGAAEMTHAILTTNSDSEFFFVLFGIAVVPAICEELFFRGAMQPLIAKATRNVHIAIWATAIIFSMVHVQFYGFLPRVFLGAMLGYLVIWSGSLWVSIFAHFCNNAMGVIAYTTYHSLDTPTEGQETWFAYALSFLLFGVMTYWFNKHSKWPWIGFQYLGIPEETDTSSNPE